jgi:hypothetical protein
MKIGIEINGVLRDTIGKFKTVYEKYMIPNDDDIILKTYRVGMSGDTINEEHVEDDFEYGVISEPTSLNLLDHFKFKSSEEMFQFMFEEFPMEIFGHAMSSEINSFNLLNEFYIKNRDKHDIYLISDEISKSKPATLFFLSKFSCLIENIIFYNDKTKKYIFSNFDLLVTSNPNLIIDNRNKFSIIKYNTEYNKNLEHVYNIDSLSELDEKIKKIYDKNL